MLSKYQMTDLELLQLWAEYSKPDLQNYSVEVSSSDAYFREYSNYTQYNYWEWYLIPKEVLFKPTSKVTSQQKRLKPNKTKAKPLLFNNHNVIPLRI